MSQRQGQFLQLLGTLASIQQNREELDFRKTQHADLTKIQKDQLQQLKEAGLSKDILEAIKTYSDLGPEARRSFDTILKNRAEFQGMPGVLEGLLAFGQNQPVAPHVRAAMEAERGFGLMSQGERDNNAREAARLATTGQNQGQLAQGAAMASAFGGGPTEGAGSTTELNKMYGDAMTKQFLMGAVSRAMTGVQPFEGAVGQAALNAGYAPNAARMSYQGVEAPIGKDAQGNTVYGAMQPVQAGQLDVQRGQVAAAMAGQNVDLMRALAAASGQQSAGENIARMANIVKEMTGKNATGTANAINAQLFNSLAEISGQPHLKFKMRIGKDGQVEIADLPEKLNMIQKFLNAAGLANFGAAQPPSPPQQPPPFDNVLSPQRYMPPGTFPQPPQGFSPFATPRQP